ncbi:LysR family transcriptional regulator [Azohydromonas lata]|uniref:LysR family transcriptional regulator n=1 Tax=Azohydromonas lata TaxID=45677 RepID=UPI00083443BA|nr:LysR family transcriptional regulator [Azohydromonas lata]
MHSDHDPAQLLDPKLLTLFVLLYTTRSVTRAAEALEQSQPTVSAWLARLRELLGDPLFVRTGAGMQPTPRAEALVEPVREALQSLRRISAPAREFVPAQAQRGFRVCMTDASHITLLPRLLRRVRAQAPRVRLEAIPIDDGTPRELEAGHADLALGIIPGLESGFYQQVFYEQDFVCLVSPQHPLIHDTLTLEQYQAAAHVQVLSGKSHALLEEALKAQRVQRDVLLRLPGFLGLATVVADTDLVATVPRQIGETLARNGGLKVLACPIAVPRYTVKQYWHARMHHDPANRWLRNLCASLYMNG